MIFDNYTLLGVTKEASDEEIKKAYERKIAGAKNELIREKYKTAYYVLTRYRKTEIKKRKWGIVRAFLTLLDALFTFYWCFIAVLITYMVITKDLRIIDAVESYLLTLFAVLDLLFHYYIRRLNRYLKEGK